MLLYLTGAKNSLSKSLDNPQRDANDSLGGYISSTPVPNASLNSLFDTISSYTIEKKQKETIAIGLINKLEKTVKNVELKIISDKHNLANFKVAAVSVGSDYRMESIANRYQEPMSAEFHDATFYRSTIDIEVQQYASIGEEIALFPFGITFTVDEEGWDGTWSAFNKAFSKDENYSIRRISEKRYRITRRDDSVVEESKKCSYVCTEGFRAEFIGDLKTDEDNSVLISETIKPMEAVGLWIQRDIKDSDVLTNSQLLSDYKNKVLKDTVENVEIVIIYELSDE